MRIDAGFVDVGYEQNILRYNDIDVLVPFHTVDINNVTQVWYDITGLMSLSDYLLQQGITVELIRKVLVYLKIALDEVERFLIDTNHLLLDPDTLYVVKNNNEWKLMFIYYPNSDSELGLEVLMEFIMNNVDKQTMETALMLYDAITGGTTIDALIALIDDVANVEPAPGHPVYEPPISDEYNDEYNVRRFDETDEGDIFPDEINQIEEHRAFKEMMEMGAKKSTLLDKIKEHFTNYFSKYKNKNKNKYLADKLEDFAFEPNQQIYEPTVLLKSPDMAKKAYELRYMGNNQNENIHINKDEITLGSSREGNDSVINSPVISRFHAKIIREGSAVYLQDLNSTNGTTVNGKLLGYRDKVQLNPNDEIMFADERYRFV